MSTIGQLLKEARMKKSYSKAHLEGLTKIKKDFLQALESEDWQTLPEYPVVRGFVRSVADSLELSSDQALAFLRRDYPPTKLSLTPKPDVENKFVWTPRLTFITGTTIILLAILGYLVMQYIGFTSSPKLEVIKPGEAQVVNIGNLQVEGKTDPGATIKINNQQALVTDDGKFTTEIEVNQDTQKIEIIARARSGKETTIVRVITVQLKN